MAGSLNKVTLIGALGKDPEVRTAQSGFRVVTFSIATSESWKDKASGERKSITEWTNIVIMNERLGDVAEKYLKKGNKVYLEGKLQTRKWTDKNGNDRYTTEVLLGKFGGELILLEKNDVVGSTQRSHAQTAKPAPDYDDSDEIPF